MADKSWAEETAEKIKFQGTKTDKVVAEDRLIRAQAPTVWAELRKWLKENCEDLNKYTGTNTLTFEVAPSTEATIRRLNDEGKVRATLTVEFDLDARRIRYDCTGGKGELIFVPKLEDSSVTMRDAYHRIFSCETAGRMLLDFVIASPF